VQLCARLVSPLALACVLSVPAWSQEQVRPPDLPGLEFSSIREAAFIAEHGGEQPGAAGGSQASFTPDGEAICYMFIPPGPTRSQLLLRSMVHGALLSDQLAPTEFRSPSDPRLSPDGKRLLFTGWPEGSYEDPLGIWLTDLEGSKPSKITPTDFNAAVPAWSPDGRTIAFLKWPQRDPADDSGAAVESSLAFMDAQEPYQVRGEVPGLTAPLYSPDGRWVACKVSGHGKMGVLDVEANELHPLFDGETVELSFSRSARAHLVNYAWLPDSQRLLLTVRGNDRPQTWWRVWMVNLAGETRQMFDGRLLGGPVHARILFIEKDGHVYRVDFD
jgi:hypothetical protein